MTAPQKSEAPLAGGAIAEEGTEEASILTASEATRKRFATLQARFALTGRLLLRDSPAPLPPLCVVSSGVVKTLASLDDAERWLEEAEHARASLFTGGLR